jgi:hypothetical protein
MKNRKHPWQTISRFIYVASRQQDFQRKLTVAFTGKERIDLSPVYVCQKTLVCLDRGYTELVVPAPDWNKSGKAQRSWDSEGETAH